MNAALLNEPLSGTPRATTPSLWHRLPWWIIGFGSPLVMFAAAQLAARTAGQDAPSWHDLGRVNFLPELGFIAWWLW